MMIVSLFRFNTSYVCLSIVIGFKNSSIFNNPTTHNPHDDEHVLRPIVLTLLVRVRKHSTVYDEYLNQNSPSSHNIIIMSILIKSIIPVALATISAFKAFQNESSDTKWFQIALLIVLILLQNVETTKIKDFQSNTTNKAPDYINTDSENESKIGSSISIKDNLELKDHLDPTNTIIIVQIFLALFLSLIHQYRMKFHSYHPIYMSWNSFITYVKIGIRSLLLTLLLCIYFLLLVHVWSGYRNYDIKDDYDKQDYIQSSKFFFIFIIIWGFLTWRIWISRQKILYGPQYGSKTSDIGLPYQVTNLDYDNEDEWNVRTNEQLICWIRSKLHQQQHYQMLLCNNNNPYSKSRYVHQIDNKKELICTENDKRLEDTYIYVDDDVIIDILQTMMVQEINGSILPYIQIQDLVNMGIRYAHAVYLFKSFRLLMERNTQANMMKLEHDGEGVGIDLDKWLGKKIGAVQSSHQEDESNDVFSPYPPYGEVKDIMSRKFGMTIPQAKTPGKTMGETSALPESLLRSYMSPLMATSNQNVSGHTELELDEKFLDEMPPNIREIAERNPEFVMAMQQKISHEKNQPLQSTSYSQRERKVRFQDDIVQETESDFEEDEINEEGYGTKNTIVDLDEMVGLLRRRRVNP